jgi:hypothetical protein
MHARAQDMTKLHQDNQAEPFFITEDVAAELTAAGYEFEAPEPCENGEHPRAVWLAARRDVGRGRQPPPGQAMFTFMI